MRLVDDVRSLPVLSFKTIKKVTLWSVEETGRSQTEKRGEKRIHATGARNTEFYKWCIYLWVYLVWRTKVVINAVILQMVLKDIVKIK